jgi:hypothetical protein
MVVDVTALIMLVSSEIGRMIAAGLRYFLIVVFFWDLADNTTWSSVMTTILYDSWPVRSVLNEMLSPSLRPGKVLLSNAYSKSAT